MPRLQLDLKYWCLAGLTCLAILSLLEIFFRSQALWRLPLGFVIAESNDNDVRSVWRSYQPPANADLNIALLGASSAYASMELPNQGTAALLATQLNKSVEFRSLCAGRASFADYLAYLENLRAGGYHPHLLIAYTWPGMFTTASVEKAAAHTRFIPLVSNFWLNDVAQRGDTTVFPNLSLYFIRHLAIVRHRYYVNSWTRQRLTALLHGRAALNLVYDDTRYRNARTRPLETDRDRMERTRALPQQFREQAAHDVGFVAFLKYVQAHRVKTILVEAPHSPPVRTLLAPLEKKYQDFVTSVARNHQVVYVNPNSQLLLQSHDFADLYHVSWAGREKWLQHLVPVLARYVD